MQDAAGEGVSYDGKIGKIKADDHTIDSIIHFLERLLDHPVITLALLLLIGFIVWDLNRSRVKISAQKEEFSDRRFQAQQQYSLPLDDDSGSQTKSKNPK